MKEFYSILWQEKYIKDLCIVVKDKYDPKNNDTNEKIYIGLENMMTNKGIISKNNSLKIKSVKTKFEKYDLLYGRLRPYLNKHDVVTFDGICSTDILVFRFKNKITAKYINYYFDTVDFIKYVVKNSNGINLPRVSAKEIGLYKIKLPPINEQQRIVNIIESLFAKLDRAKELIENTLAQWEQNKMAILHKAFTGELTVKWRKENNIDLSSWEIVSIKDIGEVKGGKRLPKGEMLVNENTGHPYIKAGNLKNGTVAFNDLQYLKPQVYEKIKKYIVKENDVYITIVGACIGDVGIIPKEVNGANLTENAAKITNLKCNAKFLSIQLSISSVQKQIKGKIASATLGKLSLQNIKNIQIKMPTIEEQQKIVNILDRLLAKYNKIKNLEQQLEKIELLKKAILAKAFRGELGTNNPDEESAENLLKEILAEK